MFISIGSVAALEVVVAATSMAGATCLKKRKAGTFQIFSASG